MSEEEKVGSGLGAGAVVMIPLDSLDYDDTTYMFRAALRTGPLVDSLKAHGQQIPIVVRKRRQGQRKYQVISGFRRMNAAKEAGFTEIAAVERDLTDEEAFTASVLENTARKTYSDIERAYVIQAHKARGLGGGAIGKTMGLTKRQVNNIESLLQLPEEVQAAIDDPEQHFKATHALTLKKLSAKYPDLDYGAWITQVNETGISVAQLIRAVNSEYKSEEPDTLESLFQEKGTDADKGVFRFAPVKIEVSKLTADEKGKLKAELQALLAQLG